MSCGTFSGTAAALWRARRLRLAACWGLILAISGSDAVWLRGELALRHLPATAFAGGDVLFRPLGADIALISIWGVIILCTLVSTLAHVRGGKGSFDTALVALSGSRARWWGAEALVCLLTVAADCAALLAGTLLWTFVLGGRVGLGSDCATYSFWGGNPDAPMSYPWTHIMGFFGVFLVGLVALSLVQLALSLAIGTIPAFIVSVAHLSTAWFFKHSSAPIARLLVSRSSIFVEGGLRPETGAGLFALVGAAAFLGGLALVSRIDIGVGRRR